MMIDTATAMAHPNIALIKYWGDQDPDLHLPENGSISMNLEELHTQTTVRFDPHIQQDLLTLNGQAMQGEALERVMKFMQRVRQIAGISLFARVESENNFPVAAGLASSAAGFAALSLAATKAAGVDMEEADLSRLARTGSGSASRSVPGGFVEWQVGRDDYDSFAFSIAAPEHWALADCIALVSQDKKPIASSAGHTLAHTSRLQDARVADTPRRLTLCRQAIVKRDFTELAAVAELDSNLMHAVMITSTPPLIYWQPETLAIMHAVQRWRSEGLPSCYTIDAGPNVHVLCLAEAEQEVRNRLLHLDGVRQVITAHPGHQAMLVNH